MYNLSQFTFADYPALTHPDAKDRLLALGAECFCREYGTSGTIAPRQSGKTTAIVKLAQGCDIVIHRTMYSFEGRERLYAPHVTHLSAGQNIGHLYRGRNLPSNEFITVWFDEIDAEDVSRIRSEFISNVFIPCRADVTRVRFVTFRSGS